MISKSPSAAIAAALLGTGYTFAKDYFMRDLTVFKTLVIANPLVVWLEPSVIGTTFQYTVKPMHSVPFFPCFH